MPFSFHPPTGRSCPICEALDHSEAPIIDTHNGKASSANNFPFHNWYNFVLGYSPEFPEWMLQRENIGQDDLVVDPFMGSGTTLIVCKTRGIPSQGIDANNFMIDAAKAKLTWNLDLQQLKHLRDDVLDEIAGIFAQYRWNEGELEQLTLFANGDGSADYRPLLTRRPTLLLTKYLSDKPYAQAVLIADVIEKHIPDPDFRRLFDLALTSIIIPISNIKYGPGFGVGKPKSDVDVLSAYAAKLQRMIADLETVTSAQKSTPADVFLGDARCLSDQLAPNSASLMITSPPYPGDHEYTKHTKLELLFRGYADSHAEFQVIKKRMIRASTTNLYRQDHDRTPIENLVSIQNITRLIQNRLEEDGATSGFEKLYTKLVWEYFGGMYKALLECYAVLRPGGKIALLVSDSHAFKMVHIQTAAILCEIGQHIGFIEPEIILWQNKKSTSHRYNLRENVLMLQKPPR